MHSLLEKRVLFISPRFFGYEKDIANEMRERGADVDVLPDRPFDTPLMKAATRFLRPLVIGFADRYYRREIKRLGRAGYDIVLIVNGQTVSSRLLKEIKASYPRAKFILYMWDSFGNRRSSIANLKFFDDCFSFDQDCSKQYGLKFRPLFFAPGFDRPYSDLSDYQISFVGTCHSDRYSIVSNLAKSLGDPKRFYRYLYLQAPWVYYIYRLINPAFRGAQVTEFRFKALSRKEVEGIFFRSKAILDIEHPDQTGLTIRTLETIGSSRKLVTTNPRVREYDFFSPNNICVIERIDAAVPEGFWDAPFEELGAALKAKYGIKGWIDDVLDGRGNTFVVTAGSASGVK